MDALRLLRADHKDVAKLFEELTSLSETAHVSRAKLFDRIDEALEVHAKIEETIFYPALKRASRREAEAKKDVLEAYEEHDNVKAMLAKIKKLDPKDETYNAKLQVLQELVKHHVKEEEHSIFEDAEELLGEERLVALGEELQAAKAELMGGSPPVLKGDVESDVERRSPVR